MMKIKSKNKRYSLFLVIVLLACMIAGAIYYLHSSTKPSSPIETDKNTSTDSTSKGQGDIVISNNIPKDSLPSSVESEDVKNYITLIENEKYKIRKLNNDYTVTLYPIINNPDQYSTYKDQLVQFKQEALTYMKSKNIDPTKVKIIYEPNEATNL